MGDWDEQQSVRSCCDRRREQQLWVWRTRERRSRRVEGLLRVVQPQVTRIIYARKSEEGTVGLEQFRAPRTNGKSQQFKLDAKDHLIRNSGHPYHSHVTSTEASPTPLAEKRSSMWAIESLITCRGLLFVTTHFKTSM